jgi:hypothetical protein
VFFDKTDSVNIYNIDDFHKLDRVWLVPFSNDSIDIDYGQESNDSIPYFDTLLPYQYVIVPGRAYAVPVNIDTSDLNENEYHKRGIKTFSGKVKGTVVFNFTNRLGNNVDLKIAGILVRVWEQTGGWAKNKLLGSAFTNNDGFFDIEYDRTKLNFDDNIQIFVEIVCNNSSDDLQVGQFRTDGFFQAMRVFTSNINHPHNGGDRVTLDLELISVNRHSLAPIFHWANREIDYVKYETSGMGLNFDRLRIHLYEGWSHYKNNDKLIELNINDIEDEGTVQHEVGHYIHLSVLQEGKRQENSGGTHTFVNNNSHPNQTITEGFADFLSYCTDARFFADDDEYDRFVHFPISTRVNTHLFTAEQVFAQTVFDLFDDVALFSTFGIIASNDVALINDFGEDNISLPLGDLLRPFTQHKSSNAQTIQDVAQYFKQLIDNTSNCKEKHDIKRILDLSHRSISNFTSTFNQRLSTDVVCELEIISHRDEDLMMDGNFNVFEGNNSHNYNYNYFIIDENELNSTDRSFNYGNSSQQTQYPLSYLSDILHI